MVAIEIVRHRAAAGQTANATDTVFPIAVGAIQVADSANTLIPCVGSGAAAGKAAGHTGVICVKAMGHIGAAGQTAVIADAIIPGCMVVHQSANLTGIVFPCVGSGAAAGKAADRTGSLGFNAIMATRFTALGAAIIFIKCIMGTPRTQGQENALRQSGTIIGGSFVFDLTHQ